MKHSLYISATSFATNDKSPLELLERLNIKYDVNKSGKKIPPDELADIACDYDAVIAGTENLLPLVMKSNKLKLISRIGVGLNSIPLPQCKQKNIKVTYTPDAVIDSVAELAVGHILNSIRHVNQLDDAIRNGNWKRILGNTVNQSTIGIVGFGRIARRVRELVLPFKPSRLLIHELDKVNDLEADSANSGILQQQVKLDYLFRESDIITLHLPLTKDTVGLINKSSLALMKDTAFLINTSRGGIINENELYQSLADNKLSGAALDVFENEPYSGKLLGLKNILLTSHVGSYTDTCRARMELEAVEDVIRFFKDETLQSPVPDSEFESNSI